MPDYFYTATNPSGKRRTECIQAASAQDALRELESSGFVEIELNTDDIDAILNGTIPDRLPLDDIFSESELRAIQHYSNLRLFLFMLKKSCWYLRWLILLALILFSFSLNEPNPMHGYNRGFGLLLLLLPGVFALKASVFSPFVKYKRMYEALYWGNWNTVIKTLPDVRKYRSAFETGTIEASALAALGKLDSALKIMLPFASSQEIPHWLYLIELAKVYEHGDQSDQSLESTLQAYHEARENPVVLLSYANILLKQNKDPSLVSKLIQEAEVCPKNDVREPFLLLCKGQLELNLGEFQKAVQVLQEAKKQLEPQSHSQPDNRLNLDFCDAWTAIALAELGETEQAETLYQSALPRLQALNAKRTIERYQQAVNKY
ncbi:hypothetical protein [Gimesia fumaroli]|uniref:Tetratricopeptide repeat protein n=1 Tax=Gimesia fumaroli TaxID=2527976 RepID=A0A518I724_9PLAN|nr:hypothetical protein [Gimesia fumaroli]QDV48880.1 hypothetical protein Enr17x_08950 [Gimesia fumaroli]